MVHVTAAEPVDLLATLRHARGYEAALLTTYNAHLPFFEEVVWRRLRAAGARHIVLLMDAARLADALAEPHTRPRHAGSGYTLVPVPMRGAFHPKVLMLVGETKGIMHVGSHNVTLSGYTRNRELTTRVDAGARADRAGAALFRDVLGFCRTWLEQEPEPMRVALAAVEGAGKRWLGGPSPASDTERLFGTVAKGKTLWSQVRPHLPEKAGRVAVVGPFFDARLAFLDRIAADLRPDEMVVALGPDAVIDVDRARGHPAARFVAAGSLGVWQSEGAPLHAKALLVEANGEEFLIAGSANPSAPAWLRAAPSGNAEIIVLRRGKKLGQGLGLTALFDAPDLVDAQWEEVRDNFKARRSEEPGEDPRETSRPLVFVEEGRGFAAHQPSDGTLGVLSVTALGAEGEALGEVAFAEDLEEVWLEAPDAAGGRASVVAVQRRNGRSIGLLHRTSELEVLSATSKQRKLRLALAGLEGDPAQLESLMKMVQRVIFGDEGVRQSAPRGAPDDATDSQDDSPERAVPPKRSRSKAARRRLAQGDLAMFLDLVIHRLGQALIDPGAVRPGRSDEELVGTEEEEEDELEREVIVGRVAELCRKKSVSLLNRMTKVVAKLSGADDQATGEVLVTQGCAVLGLVWALRRAERRAPWTRPGSPPESLVDERAVARFLDHGGASLARAARDVAESANNAPEEVVRVQGLLAWLCWSAGLRLDVPQVDAEDLAPRTAALICLAEVALPVCADEAGLTALMTALQETDRRYVDADRWMRALQAFACALREPQAMAELQRPLQQGDLVVAGEACRVARKVYGNKIDVVDPTHERGFRTFLVDRVRGLDWARLPESVRARGA